MSSCRSVVIAAISGEMPNKSITTQFGTSTGGAFRKVAAQSAQARAGRSGRPDYAPGTTER
jgi:hypothetical protein